MSTAIVLASSVLPPFVVPPVASPSPVTRSDEATEARRRRGLMIAALCRITHKDGIWVVPSQTGNGSYRVNLNPKNPAVPMCTCDDFAQRGAKCKHVFAVEFVLSREQGDTSTEVVYKEMIIQSSGRPPTLAPKPTYQQAWPAYNAAQIHEKAKFLVLLKELCQGLREPPRPAPKKPGGRPRITIADRVFAAALKVYTTTSGRRASTDMRDARAKGHLARAPHYTSVYRFLEDPALTPILKVLIAESAKPLGVAWRSISRSIPRGSPRPASCAGSTTSMARRGPNTTGSRSRSCAG